MRKIIRNSNFLVSRRTLFDDPSAIATIISGAITGGILYKTSKDRDNMTAQTQEWQKQARFQDDLWRIDNLLDNYKKDILDILYGDTHRKISDEIAHLESRLSIKNQQSETESEYQQADGIETESEYQKTFNNNYQTAKTWFRDYNIVQGLTKSLEEKKKAPAYQINMARAAVRDNFSRLSLLLEDYANKLTKRNKISQDLNQEDLEPLLSIGQAREILDRYERFVINTKPFDEVMGYNGIIYEFSIFFNKVRLNLSDKDKQEFVKFIDKDRFKKNVNKYR